MSTTITSAISSRAGTITTRVNSDFRSIVSDTRFSLYVGSYGRGTDIHVSDIDMIVQLPPHIFEKYDAYRSNGQSALISALKDSIATTYPTTFIRGDGQVVKINFSDGICFEVVPAFLHTDQQSFKYPDTNNGGSWGLTNPRAEFDAINLLNILTNHNLKRLCRMARAWKSKWNVEISGWLIDTLAYYFIRDWHFRDKSYLYYDLMTRDFFEYLKEQRYDKEYWIAPGSYQRVPKTGVFRLKASQCYDIALEAIKDETKYPSLAHSEWQDIYGTKFPSSPS